MNKIILICLGVVVFVTFFVMQSCSRPTWIIQANNDLVGKDVAISNINIFLDASVSMRGYTDGVSPKAPKNLKSVVSTLVTQSEQYSKSTKLNCAAIQNNSFVPVSSASFPFTINDNSIFKGQFTDFGYMLTAAVAKTSPSDVSILISDCIMSYPPGQTDKNVVGIDNLKVEVVRALQAARQKGLSIAIFKYCTDFTTKFYCDCDNNTPQISSGKDSMMHNRPYYCILLGKSDAINSLNNHLKNVLPANNGVYYREASSPKEVNVLSALNAENIGATYSQGDTIQVDPEAVKGADATNDIVYLGIQNLVTPPFMISETMRDTLIVLGQQPFVKSTEAIQQSKFEAEVEEEQTVSRIYQVTLQSLQSIANAQCLANSLVIIPIQGITTANSSMFPDNKLSLQGMEGKTFAMDKVLEAIDQAYLDCPMAAFNLIINKVINN